VVKKYTTDQILYRDEAYKLHIERCKTEGRVPKTRRQFNKQWEKTHRGYAP
jgi:hypothetical protein